MRYKILACLSLAAGLPPMALGQSAISGGTYYSASIPTAAVPKLESADYALWIPAGVTTLRGILMRQHGCGTATWKIGLNHVHDLQWQALARRHSLALMSSRYVAPDGCEAWTAIQRGSDRLFLEALDRLAAQSGHPEIARVPWVLWGHSGGARWSASMLLRYPSRVAAAVLARCGEAAGENREAAQVPVLWAPAAHDHLARCISVPLDSVHSYRKLGALWTLAIDPVAGHELAEHRSFAIPYLDAVLSQRLGGKSRDPRPMDPARVWLGNPSTFAVVPAASSPGNPSDAVWLPDQATAQLWREFAAAGRVMPPQPPVAADHLRVNIVSATAVELTFQAEAGLLTGLPSFAVLRDGIVVGSVHGQSHGYHDDPSPVDPELRFRDTGLTAGQTYQYRVVPLASYANSTLEAVTPSAETLSDLKSDLVVTRIAWSPVVQAVIENRGNGQTPPGIPIEILFRVDGQDAGWSEYNGTLAPGASQTVSLTHTADKSPGSAALAELGAASHTLEATVDYRNRIMELDENNNNLTVRTAVQPQPR